MYNLSDEQTDNTILEFKKKCDANISKKSVNTGNALALDSSIWVLEAVLNYDFDESKTIEDMFKDSLVITAPIINNQIGSTDFENVYLALKTLLDQKRTNTVKVQVVDVTAKIIDDKINYFLNITLFNSLAGKRVTTPCDPFTTETASPSLFATVTPSYANPFLVCSGNPTLDGPSAVETKLNSCSYPACSGGFYYTNVTSVKGGGLGYPGRLYTRTNITPYSNFCLPANKIITATELNQYKTGAQYLGNLWKPTTPAGLSIINNYDITLEVYSTLCCGSYYYAFWNLEVSYGILHCNNAGSSRLIN